MIIKVSRENTKLGKIPNISLRPIADCANCESCRKDCSSLKAWRQYPHVKNAWSTNSVAFRSSPVQAMGDLDNWLNKRRKPPRFFRVHVAGDFLNQRHVNLWNWLAERHDKTKFLAFTKQHGLEYLHRPRNLQIVLSMFPTMNMPPEENDYLPKAWVTNDSEGNVEDRIPSDAIECAGSCLDCGMCWSLDDLGKDVYFHLH